MLVIDWKLIGGAHLRSPRTMNPDKPGQLIGNASFSNNEQKKKVESLPAG